MTSQFNEAACAAELFCPCTGLSSGAGELLWLTLVTTDIQIHRTTSALRRDLECAAAMKPSNLGSGTAQSIWCCCAPGHCQHPSNHRLRWRRQHGIGSKARPTSHRECPAECVRGWTLTKKPRAKLISTYADEVSSLKVYSQFPTLIFRQQIRCCETKYLTRPFSY